MWIIDQNPQQDNRCRQTGSVALLHTFCLHLGALCAITKAINKLGPFIFTRLSSTVMPVAYPLPDCYWCSNAGPFYGASRGFTPIPILFIPKGASRYIGRCKGTGVFKLIYCSSCWFEKLTAYVCSHIPLLTYLLSNKRNRIVEGVPEDGPSVRRDTSFVSTASSELATRFTGDSKARSYFMEWRDFCETSLINASLDCILLTKADAPNKAPPNAPSRLPSFTSTTLPSRSKAAPPQAAASPGPAVWPSSALNRLSRWPVRRRGREEMTT